jgi:nucleotide-binding universal stress UspA family protein
MGGERTSMRDAGCVVFALNSQQDSTAGLLRAAWFARTLSARLHVLLVLPRRRFRSLQAFVTPPVPHSERGAQNRLREWAVNALGKQAVERFATARGDFVASVTNYADETDALAIVAPARKRRCGQTAAGLAIAARRPVLVAREAGPADTIVVASDLQQQGYPVLREGSKLARALGRPMVAVHNVPWDPLPALDATAVGADWVWPGLSPRTPEVHSRRGEELARALQLMRVRAETIVRCEFSTTDAILSEASLRDADLVVVGTRARSWLTRQLVHNVATEVADRARRSVLVTPLLECTHTSAVAPVCWV